MFILRGLATLFLLPGTLVIQKLNISVEEDGGIIRSSVNMIVWALVGLFFVIAVMV